MPALPDETLAAQADIPVGILRAIRSVESSGNPSAVRFEPHVFWRLMLGLPSGTSGGTIKDRLTAAQNAQVPYTPCNTSWRSAHGLAPCRRDMSASLVGAETNRAAFDRARRVDAQNAIKATSWGLYQVLGDHLLRAFPSSSDPVAAFYADPLDASNRMLVSWFHANPHAAAAARATPPDFSTLADIYNGSQVWGAHVAAALLRGDMGIVRASAVQVVTEHPVPVAIGVAMLAGGAAFAWWAYTKSKRVKRNRRSSRVRRNGSRPVRIEPRPDMQSKAYWVVSDGGATIGVVGELKDLGGWWAAPMVGYNRGYITRMSQKDAIDTVADEFETWERHGGVRKNRRSSRVRRNKIVAPVTLVAVGAGGEHALGTARGRAEFVKLVKQVTPTLAPGQRLEVRGAHRSLREIGVQANGQLQILTKDRWVQITAAF